MKNLMDMMKQAKQLQEKMAEMQTAVEQINQTGTAGAGLVSVTLNGKGVMSAVKIDPSLLKDSEGEILEDLIVAAHNDAVRKVESTVQDRFSGMASGLGLPPGFKLPF